MKLKFQSIYVINYVVKMINDPQISILGIIEPYKRYKISQFTLTFFGTIVFVYFFLV